MRDYNITVSGKAFNIPYRSTNKESSLVLHGNDSTNYGQALLTNLIRLTDNFCDSKPPPNPILGQTYYNYTTKKLSVYKKNGWSEVALVPNTDYLDVVYLDETSKGPHGTNILPDVLTEYVPLSGNDVPIGVMTIKTSFDIPNEAVTKAYVDEIFREKSTVKYLPLAAETATMSGALRLKSPIRKDDSRRAVTVGYINELGVLTITDTPTIQDEYNFVVTTYDVTGRLDNYKQPDTSDSFTSIYFSALLTNTSVTMLLPVTFLPSSNMKSGFDMTVVCKSVDVNVPVYSRIDNGASVTIRRKTGSSVKVDGIIYGFTKPTESVSRDISTVADINANRDLANKINPPVASTPACCCNDTTPVTTDAPTPTTTTTNGPTTTTTNGPTTTTTNGPTTTTTEGTTTTTTEGTTTTTTEGPTTTTTTIASLPETPGNPSPTANGIDLVFVVDYTSSMGGVINKVRDIITDIANLVSIKSNNNYRFGLVLFDETTTLTAATMSAAWPQYSYNPDYKALPAVQKYENTYAIKKIKQVIFAMEMMSTNNVESLKTQLNKINQPRKTVAPFDAFDLGMGGGAPEPGDIALDKVHDNFAGTWRDNVAKVVVFITDAKPGGTDDANTIVDTTNVNEIASKYKNKNIRMLLLTTDELAGKTAVQTDLSYANMATSTGGSISSPITNPSLIIDAINAIP